jgi:hypothetical protein
MRTTPRILAIGIMLAAYFCPALAAASEAQSPRNGTWFLKACDESAVLVGVSPENMNAFAEWGHCAGYVAGLSDMLHGSLSLTESVTGRQNYLGICLPDRGMSGGMWMELLRSYLDRHPESLATPLRTVLLLASRETFPCAPTP